MAWKGPPYRCSFRGGIAIDAQDAPRDLSDVVLYTVADHVATITLNRPAALNALNRPARRALGQALDRARDDGDVRVVVLTGAGRAFSVGQDVAELASDYESAPPALARLIYDEWVPLVEAMRKLPKPVVAAVNGAAAGGGLSLALAADIRLAETHSRFIAAFVGVGLVPDSGASHHLVRLVGLSKAMELCLTSKPLAATDALALGLVASVAEDSATLAAEACQYAAQLAAGAPMAQAGVKAILHAAADASFDEIVALEAEWQDRLGGTEDHREALDAFLSKRRPTFRGQ